MEIGVLTTVFADSSLADALPVINRLGIGKIEMGCGGLFPKNHCDPASLLASPGALAEYRDLLRSYGVEVAALAIHGQPLHPDQEISQRYATEFEQACLLAAELGVTKLTLLAGLPEAYPGDRYPNWVWYPFPPENLRRLEWQWAERLIPYWKRQAPIAADCGLRLCFEMHPAELVYNVRTLLRLRDAIGPVVGANLDPSHLTWQGMDITEVVSALSDVIYHVHAKDSRINARALSRNGIIDSRPLGDVAERSWLFRTIGYGQNEEWWRSFMSSLRAHGYDDVLCIEHEDPLLDPVEGLERGVEFLSQFVLRKPPSKLWYDA
jgi:sugar phosphate isomerase/epimerase